jgi:DNA-binding MarR family transcriptional regulator
VVLVYPTDAGGRIFSDMADRRREALSRVLAELSDEEMAALLVGVRAMHTAKQKMLIADQNATADLPPEPPPAE